MNEMKKLPNGAQVHKSSFVDGRGDRSAPARKIWHFCHVMGGAVIGERCSLGQNLWSSCRAPNSART